MQFWSISFVGRKIKKEIFFGEKSADRFRSLSKGMFETQTEVQFEDAHTEIGVFYDENEKKASIKQLACLVGYRKRPYI